jgi:hypothetical protein
MLTVAELNSVDASGLRATQRAFLDALAETGSMTRACSIVGIERTTPYHWIQAEGFNRTEPEDAPEGTFTHALQRAKMIAAENVLGQVHAQALSDSAGMPAAIQRMFVVKRWMPEYRDQLNVKHSGAVLTGRIDLNQLDQDERRDLLGLVARRLTLPAPTTDADPDNL